MMLFAMSNSDAEWKLIFVAQYASRRSCLSAQLNCNPNTKPRSMMASNRLEEKDFVNYKVLKFLKENPDMSQREMAQHLGISNGGMHYCLNALMDKGLIKLGNFASSKHKLGYCYLLTPKGFAKKSAMTGRFLERKMAEYESLKAEITLLKEDAKVEKAILAGGKVS